MSDNVIDITERLADIDCRKWSCADALRKALADIESGKNNPRMIFIAGVETEGDVDVFPYWVSGGDVLQIMGMLAMHARYFESR
jgi:hypothetical protein